MNTTIGKFILAVVTTNRKAVAPGGAPVFFAENASEMQRLAFLLEKILDGTAHDLEIGIIIIVRH